MNIQITNSENNDFINRRYALHATTNTKTVHWTIPNRVMRSPALPIIIDELVAEATE